MRKFAFFIFLLIIMAQISCKTSSNSSEEKNTTEFSASTFEINYFEGGGMIPESRNVLISKEVSYWKFFRYGKETVVNWNTSEDELKELYQFLKKHNYSKIACEKKGQVYDRGGMTVNIKNGTSEVEINNSGSFFIEEKWLEDYKAIKKKLTDFMNTKVYHKKLNVRMSSSAQILELQHKYEISVHVDGEMGMDSESRQTGASPTFKVFEGLNKIDIRAFYRDSTGDYGNKVSYQQDMIFLEATKATRTLFLDFVGGKFVVTFQD